MGAYSGCLGNPEVACVLCGSQYEELGDPQGTGNVHKVLQNVPLGFL